MFKNKMTWNVVALLVAGLLFPGYLGIRSGETLLDNLWSLFSAQFVFAAMSALLNPFAAAAVGYLFVVIYFQDTLSGQKSLETKSVRTRKLLGDIRVPLLAMGLSAIAGLVMTTINSNWWSIISLFTLIQILIFLGARKLRDSERKPTNA